MRLPSFGSTLASLAGSHDRMGHPAREPACPAKTCDRMRGTLNGGQPRKDAAKPDDYVRVLAEAELEKRALTERLAASVVSEEAMGAKSDFAIAADAEGLS